MKKFLLFTVGLIIIAQSGFSTVCGSASVIPGAPTMPYVQALTCGAGNDVNSGNVTVCGSNSYVGGQEALYAWTPLVDYTGVTIAYNGVTWTGIFIYAGCPTSGGTCVANITSSTSSKTLVVPGTLTAGVTYYIMFDTYPAPNSPCPGTFTLNGTPNIATPPTPTQAPGTPDCAVGTTIDVVGTPATDVEWYWQSSAAGTSTANLYAGPYQIFANGTYYLRALHTVAGVWSVNSSSIVVSDFPTAAAPPVPVAAMNPACVTDGTTISVAAAPFGVEYYWQGTDQFGILQTDNATTDYPVTASGTYYVRAFDIASSCWSVASGVAVTVSTIIPQAPTTTTPLAFSCVSGSSVVVNASPIGGAISYTYTLNMIDSWGDGWNGNTINVYVDGVPVLTGVTLASGTSGQVTFPVTDGSVITTQFNAIGSFAAECSFTVLNQSLALVASGNYAANIPPYTVPVGTYSIEWFDASSGGTFVANGSPLETVGTSVLPNTSTEGEYFFYAMSYLNGCYSNATEIVVTVAAVNVALTAVPVTCNNGNDGTFTLGTVTCGTGPFLYSVDGGAFGAIPTDLTVGDHDVIVQDFFLLESGVYLLTVGDALAPSGVTVNDFNYDMVDFSWTGNGSETQWYVEWGLAGFTPGTGTEVGSAIASSPTHIASGLDGFTDYDFYVAANCGGSTTAGTWVSVSQTTLCDPIVAQGFCESFNSDSPTEACWTVLNTNGDGDAWTMNGTLVPYTGDQGAQIYTDFNAGNNDDWLITPLMTLTNNEIMSFYYRSYTVGEPNNFEVRISTNGGKTPADFVDVILPLTTASSATYTNQTIDLSAYGGDCYIAFHMPTGGLDGYYMLIDQVCIDICIPDAGTDGTTDACRVDNTLDLNTVITQGETNGAWEFLPNQGVISGSDLNLGLLPDGTYDFEYIVTTACTTDTTIATITLYPASSAGSDGTIDDNCTNWSSINLTDGLSGSIDLGGSWTNVSGEGDLDGSLWTPSETTLAGSYDFEYVVSNGFCPNDTSVVTVTLISCLGVDGNETVRISVYPNPVTDVLTIQNLSIETGVIEVLDVQGKVVSAVQVNGVYGNYALDMNNVQRGMYIVRITTETSVQEVRVVKH
jgi:hypothetical protein